MVVKTLIKNLNQYVNSIPEKPLEFNGHYIKDDKGNDKMFKTSLEDYINDLLIEHKKQKGVKKMEKLMQKAFISGIPNADTYSYINYKKALSSIPKPCLQTRLDAIVKKYCNGDDIILNTNLEELGLTI